MKYPKKLFAVILSLLILVCCCPTVFAANDTPVITMSQINAMPNDTVTVDINIANNPGIMAMAFCVTYDSDAFEYVSYAKGYIKYSPTIKNHADKGHISLVYVEGNKNNLDNTTNGKMLSFTFKIKEKASPGKHIITLANTNRDKYGTNLTNCFSNSKQQSIIPLVKAGTITVGETCINAGHKYGDWTILEKSSCTKAGRREHTCVRCEYVEEADAPLADHEFDDNWTVTTKSSCTKKGEKERTCLNCDFVEKSDLPLAEHDFEADWTVDKVATKTEDGIMSRHCKNCDAVTDKITFTLQDVEDSEDDTSSEESSSNNSSDESSSSSDTSSGTSSEENTSGNSSSDNTSSDNSSTDNNTSENVSTDSSSDASVDNGSLDDGSSNSSSSDNTSSNNNQSQNNTSSNNSVNSNFSNNTTSNDEITVNNQSQNSSTATDNSKDDTQNNKKPPINNTLGGKNPLEAIEDLDDYKENIKPNLPTNDDNDGNTDNPNADTDTQAPDNESVAVDGESDKTPNSDKTDDTTGVQKQSFFAKYKVAIISAICVLAIAAILLVVFLFRKKKAE